MKRSTETVLRDEVARAEKELARAKARAEAAQANVAKAGDLFAAAKHGADVAASAVLRARQALSAFVGPAAVEPAAEPGEEPAP